MLAEIAAAVREGRVSPEELLEESLRRIDAYNPALNAVIALRSEDARREARTSSRTGPLAGIPLLVKDLVDVGGMQDKDSYPLNAGAVKQPLGTYTETGWEVFPQGMVDLLVWAKDRYGNIPTYITENGAAFFDPPVAEGGRLRDPLRTDYLQKHIRAIREAIAQGCDIRGYMVWSLLDNLEWSHGYSKRFGIVHVNYGTQERTPKDSARWYSKVIASNGASLNDPLPY